MRAAWTGAINFGLITFPVKLYPAAQEKEFPLNMLHKEDHAPIHYARICDHDGEEVSGRDIVKGYEYRKGQYVILSEEDLRRANAHKSKTIDIESFTEQEKIDPVYYDKTYYLEPEKGGDRAYALLREALMRTGKVGIGTFVFRNRKRLLLIKPEGDGLVAHQLRYHSDIREHTDLAFPKMDIREDEVSAAMELIEQQTSPFSPENYRDTYAEDLKKLVRAKVEGRTIRPKGKTPTPTRTRDLLPLLKRSVAEGRKADTARVRR